MWCSHGHLGLVPMPCIKSMFLTPHITYTCSNQASPIGSVIDLIEVSLSSQNRALQALVTPMKSKDGTWCILNEFLAHACRETIVDWVIEQACKTFKNEILQVSRAESGLHFNASQARTADILSFNLEDITQTFKALAPCTWHMVQGLLDSNPVACWSRIVTKSLIYENHHDIMEGATW